MTQATAPAGLVAFTATTFSPCLHPREPHPSHPPIVPTAPGLAQPIYIEASSSHVAEGQTLDLNCVVPGQAHAQVTWHRRGGSLPARHQVQGPDGQDSRAGSVQPAFAFRTPNLMPTLASSGTPGDRVVLGAEHGSEGSGRSGPAADLLPEAAFSFINWVGWTCRIQ